MYRGYVFVASFLLLTSCGRIGPSPVEIKVDQEYEVQTTGNVTNEMKTAIISSVENIYTPAEKLAIADNKNKNKESENLAYINTVKDKNLEKAGSKTNSKQGVSFNEQAAILSNPKIVQPAQSNATKKEKQKSKSQGILKLHYPAKGVIISKFGDDMGDGIINDGINIKAPEGNNVRAAGDGTVIYAGNKLEEDFGNVIIIQHDDAYGNLITSYAHLKNINVKNNAKVKTGDIIGTIGKTGDVKTPQLHFEVMKGRKPVNPIQYLQK